MRLEGPSAWATAQGQISTQNLNRPLAWALRAWVSCCGPATRVLQQCRHIFRVYDSQGMSLFCWSALIQRELPSANSLIRAYCSHLCCCCSGPLLHACSAEGTENPGEKHTAKYDYLSPSSLGKYSWSLEQSPSPHLLLSLSFTTKLTSTTWDLSVSHPLQSMSCTILMALLEYRN